MTSWLDVCAHTSCSPDLLSASHLLHIHQSLTAATKRPVSAGMCQRAQSEQASGQADSDRSSCLDSLSSKWNLDQTPKTEKGGEPGGSNTDKDVISEVKKKIHVCPQDADPGIYYHVLPPAAFHLSHRNMCLSYIIKSEG